MGKATAQELLCLMHHRCYCSS